MPTSVLREVCDVLHALRDDGIVDASVRDAASVGEAVAALVRDCKRPMSRDYVGQLLTLLAQQLHSEISTRLQLTEQLDVARTASGDAARKYEEQLTEMRRELGAARTRAGTKRARSSRT